MICLASILVCKVNCKIDFLTTFFITRSIDKLYTSVILDVFEK